MPKFLAFHSEPEKTWEELENAYKKLANETTARWVRTYYQKDTGRRICEWDSPCEESITVIFKRMGITWDEIMHVEEILPERWR